MTELYKSISTDLDYESSRGRLWNISLTARIVRMVFPEAFDSRLSVLIFHRILAKSDPLLPHEITVQDFRKEMAILSRHFSVLPLNEGIARLRNGTLPPFALCLTFDDGYRDNYTGALPVLREFGLKATFFVASGFLENGLMWNDALLEVVRRWPGEYIDLSDWGVVRLPMQTIEDRRRSWNLLFKWMRRIGVRGRSEMLERLMQGFPSVVRNDLMLTKEQVQQLHSEGMEIGCHTRSHPILSRISEDEACNEILGSRRELEELIQAPVRYFAYPNGVPGEDYGTRDVRLVEKCGFDAAFTTAWGAATQDADRFQLPRFTPWDKEMTKYLVRLILSRRGSAAKVPA